MEVVRRCMKYGLGAFILLLIAMLVAAPIVVSDNSDAFDQYTIDGWVVEGGAEGNIPLDNVSVSIAVDGKILNSVKTNKDGYFKVIVNQTNDLEIMFSKDGYTLSSCPNTSRIPESTFLNLDLTNVPNVDGTYTITSNAADSSCAVMIASEGNFKGTINYENGTVRDAKITLTYVSDPTLKYSTKTDMSGNFEFDNCKTGTYTYTVERAGFQTYVGEIVIVSGNITKSIIIDEKPVPTYLGLDLPHLLMAIAIVIGLALAVMVWRLNRRNDPHIDYLIDDDDDYRFN